MWCCFLCPWFHSQSSLPGKWARCVWGFGLHPAIIIRGFCIHRRPHSQYPNWLLPGSDHSSLQKHKDKANTTKTSKQASCKEETTWKALLTALSVWFNYAHGQCWAQHHLMCIMRSPKQTHKLQSALWCCTGRPSFWSESRKATFLWL